MGGLLMIFFFFKPLHIKQQIFGDVPLLNMNEFTMYELNNHGLETLVTGSNALRYKDRYVFNEVDFTDNSQNFISNIQAKHGLYKNNLLSLNGDVSYVREDGLEFESQTLTYNTKTSVAQTQDKYVAKIGENSMSGTSLEYQSTQNKITSKNVIVNYQLQER